MSKGQDIRHEIGKERETDHLPQCGTKVPSKEADRNQEVPLHMPGIELRAKMELSTCNITRRREKALGQRVKEDWKSCVLGMGCMGEAWGWNM